MSDETYTQGRLTTKPCAFCGPRGLPCDDYELVGEAVGGEGRFAAADARRLAACWNACEGLDTATIERLDVGALLDALRGMVSMVEAHEEWRSERHVHASWLTETSEARAILARVEGRAE